MNQWLVSDLLQLAGTSYEDVAAKGAVVEMRAEFDCDFNDGSSGCECREKFAG